MANRLTNMIYLNFLGLLLLFSTFVFCTNFGLISPIEVVEEWGCHDSEIRLTCSHLDSTIAILEATFTPNCTVMSNNSTGMDDSDDESDNDCIHMDMKRITRNYYFPKIDHRISETEAGRRFLQTLREKHDEDEDIGPRTQESSHSSSFGNGKTNKRDEFKQKRMTLRASLEEMIVEYLRGLAPDDERIADRHFERMKRDDGIDVHTESKTEKYSEVVLNGVQSDEFNKNNTKRVQNQMDARNMELVKNESHANDNENKKTSAKNVCYERRQRITQLDRIELNSAIQNDSDYEHNIRNLVNYRCSGKNHCSFVFADDHPFSIMWNSGSVRVKYICMESYRLNKYCGEHLIIANESPVPDPTFQTHQQRSVNEVGKHPFSNVVDDIENRLDEPVAEALIQNEQNFHHLKILKSSPAKDEYEPIETAATVNKLNKLSNRKGVYSQDFRVLKILPSNLDDFNDIEKIGDEFFFKKDEDMKTTDLIDNSLLSENERTTSPHDNNRNLFKHLHSTVPTKYDNNNNIIDIVDTKNRNDAIDGLRDIRSTSGYDKIHRKLVTPYELASSTLSESQFQPHRTESMTTAAVTSPATSTSNQYLWENEIVRENPNVYDSMEILDEDQQIISNANNKNFSKSIEANTISDVNTVANDFSVINYNRADIDDDANESGEDYKSYEDYAVEIDGSTISRKNKIRIHTSYQKTAISQPFLQQGFIATPGYPNFYIGDSNCSWRITVPQGQQIRLTLLDINLRYDPICKDFIQIRDMSSEQVLFSGCTEYTKPIEVLSQSNELQVTVKTTSKLAYPKRGVLVHYAALGCIVPLAPNYGHLVYKTNSSIKFICDPSFVFPDTAIGSRELICTSRNTWDKSLPDCIDRTLVTTTKETSSIQSSWNQNTIGVQRKMTENNNDVLYDIIIPSLVIVGLFIVNAFVLLIIMRYRNKSRKDRLDRNDELAQL